MARTSTTAPADPGLQAPAEPAARGLGRTFQALAFRDFRYLWLAQMTHAGGLWIEVVARPLLVLEITGGSAVHLGLVIATRTLPAVAFGTVAGLAADLFNRRRVLLAAKAASFASGLVFAVFLLAGWIELWHIYLFTFLRGFSMAFDQPARRAIIPSILPPNLVTNGMALSAGSAQVMRTVGAGAAGVLLATVGMGNTFLVVAALFGVAFLLTCRLRVPEYERSGYRGPRSAARDFKEGFAFAWRQPDIRGVMVVALVYFTFGASFMQVFAPLLAKQVMGIGDSGYGMIMAITGVGGIVGALLLATANPNRKRGLLIVAAIAAYGLLLVSFSLSTYTSWVAIAFVVAAFLGLGQAVAFPVINTVMLNSAPEAMRGRMMGLLSLDRAMISLGSALAGFLAALTGPQVAQVLFGIGCVATALTMAAWYPPIRRIE